MTGMQILTSLERRSYFISSLHITVILLKFFLKSSISLILFLLILLKLLIIDKSGNISNTCTVKWGFCTTMLHWLKQYTKITHYSFIKRFKMHFISSFNCRFN